MTPGPTSALISKKLDTKKQISLVIKKYSLQSESSVVHQNHLDGGLVHLCSATIAFSLSMLAPVRSATFALFFKKIKVGIAVTLYSSAMSSQSSTSTLRKTTSSMVLSISSRWGAIILQGPHHVAWKSTTTNLPPAAASWVSKSALFSTACTIFS